MGFIWRRGRASAVALVVVLVSAVTAAPVALADVVPPCSWVASDLPLPEGAHGGAVRYAAPNGYLLGSTLFGTERTLLIWHNRVPSVLPPHPVAPYYPLGINGRGEIVGYTFANSLKVPWVYRDGAYHELPLPAGAQASARAINTAGDIVGNLSDPPRVIYWPADAPHEYQVIAQGDVVGIDDQRRVVTAAGQIWSPDGGLRSLPGYPDLRIQAFRGDHIVGRWWDIGEELVEWDLAGNEVHRTPGSFPMGVNSNGLLAAIYFPDGLRSKHGTWQNGTYVADIPPDTGVYAVTEDDELAGNRGPSPWVPATWTCV